MIPRIIKVEEGVISRSRRLRPITLTETSIFLDMTKLNLIIVLLYIERKKMVTTVSGTDNLFLNVEKEPQVLSVFSLSRNQQTAPLPPSSTFLCFVSLVFNYFFGLAQSTKQTWKSCFCFFTDGKQHIARELDVIILGNSQTLISKIH